MNINVMNMRDKNSYCMNNRWNQIKQFLHCDVCINRDWPLYNLWYMYFNINVIVNDYHFRKPGVYDISTEPSGVSRYVINNPGSGCSKYWLTSVQQRGCLWLPSKNFFLPNNHKVKHALKFSLCWSESESIIPGTKLQTCFLVLYN